MKIVTVGDTHGKDSSYWGDIVDKVLVGEYDKVVFTGDYCDSFDISNVIILDSLKDIIKLKKYYPNRIVLLFGNHDVQYALNPGHVDNPYHCSGYRRDMHWDLYELFQENIDLFEFAFQRSNYLWTHAGIHQGWWDYDYPYSRMNLSNIAEDLNNSFKSQEPSIFQVGKIRGGFKDVGGPLWADKRLTSQKPLKGLHQIVGHSKVKVPQKFEIDKDTSITFCDCLDTDKNFYSVEI